MLKPPGRRFLNRVIFIVKGAHKEGGGVIR